MGVVKNLEIMGFFDPDELLPLLELEDLELPELYDREGRRTPS